MTFRNICVFVILTGFVSLLTSCQETGFYQRTGDFDQGLQYQRQGNLEPAALLFRSYLQRSPRGKDVEEAQFRLGETYYMLGDSTSAQRELTEYLRRYPSGSFQRSAQTYLASMAEEVKNTPLPSDMQPLAQREARVAQLEKQVQKKPEDVSLRIDLANAYIDVKALTLAERTIEKAKASMTTYAQQKAIEKAVKRLQEAQSIPGMYATDLHDNAGPLRISDDHGQMRQRGEVSDRRRRYFYVVTGQVENSSNKIFRNVEVQVDLYDFFENLLGSKSVKVGTINAQNKRAFSVSINLDPPAETKVSRHKISIIY